MDKDEIVPQDFFERFGWTVIGSPHTHVEHLSTRLFIWMLIKQPFCPPFSRVFWLPGHSWSFFLHNSGVQGVSFSLFSDREGLVRRGAG